MKICYNVVIFEILEDPQQKHKKLTHTVLFCYAADFNCENVIIFTESAKGRKVYQQQILWEGKISVKSLS